MTNQAKPENSIRFTVAITGVMVAICIAMVAFGSTIVPMIFSSTPVMKQVPTSKPSTQSLPKISATRTDTPDPAWTSTIMPTDSLTFAYLPTPTPKQASSANSLADLTVTGISTPTCTRDHLLRTPRVYLEFTVTVRNIGRASTYYFGPFSVRINLILGQQRYGLDEWASRFNGVIDNSSLEISNLNPNDDVELKVAIDLKGNRKFGIEAIANSGSNPIPESNATNNVLIQNFSIICF